MSRPSSSSTGRSTSSGGSPATPGADEPASMTAAGGLAVHSSQDRRDHLVGHEARRGEWQQVDEGRCRRSIRVEIDGRLVPPHEDPRVRRCIGADPAAHGLAPFRLGRTRVECHGRFRGRHEGLRSRRRRPAGPATMARPSHDAVPAAQVEDEAGRREQGQRRNHQGEVVQLQPALDHDEGHREPNPGQRADGHRPPSGAGQRWRGRPITAGTRSGARTRTACMAWPAIGSSSPARPAKDAVVADDRLHGGASRAHRAEPSKDHAAPT